MSKVFARLSQLGEEWRPLGGSAAVYAEEGESYDALVPPAPDLSDSLAPADLGFVRIASDPLPQGTPDRAAAMRTPVNEL